MDKERLEQEIECMLKYVKTLDDAKDLLAHKERLLARVLDDNKWLERDYKELDEEVGYLKEQLVKECQEHQEAMLFAAKRIKELENQLREKDARIEELEGQFAYECECNKQFVECQNELELYKRAFNVATMDLDLCRNHSQTLNDELVERVENLRNTILERIKEKMEG